MPLQSQRALYTKKRASQLEADAYTLGRHEWANCLLHAGQLVSCLGADLDRRGC